MPRRCLMLAFLLFALPVPSRATAKDLVLKATSLFEQSTSERLRLTDDGVIELERGVLYEDDGPAAGYSYRPNEEPLVDGVVARKTLVIARPPARKATLLVAPGGELQLSINGQAAKLTPAGKEGNYWQAYDFDPNLLRAGENTFDVQGKGKLWIARAEDFAAGSSERTEHPNRSAKSSDGGRTWDDERLGAKNDVDGEYYVRVVLDQYSDQGTLTLPVIDTGNLDGRDLPAPLSKLGAIHVTAGIETPKGTKVQVRARTGKTLSPNDAWSQWQTLKDEGTIDSPRGRYLQLEYELTTSDPAVTPRLKQLTITAEHAQAEDWTKGARIVGSHNPRIAHTSIPFAYEPFSHPKLAQLRREQKLDDVVAGAKTEWELIERLSAWSATRWERGHLGEIYPAWDATEILKAHRDGTPVGGFCLQYNVVFLQACESFGIPGRVMSLGSIPDKIRSGHETAEIWSNDHQKWVHIDGNTAWYFVDRETKSPLSVLELRERQLDALADRPHAAVEVKTTAKTKYEWRGLEDWPAFVDVRLIPRSNFLDERAPLPLNQGMRGWFWPGHYAFSDDRWPAGRLYSHHVTRKADFEWTLNQTRIALVPQPGAGEIAVQLDTVTPGFDTFVATIDGGESFKTGANLAWKLHSGHNRLEVRARNVSGREGPTSWIEVDYR